MESLYLVTSLFIFLAGMAFQSGVTVEGSGSHSALTWAVALVLVTCVCLFMAMLGLEVYRSYRFARRAVAAVRRTAQAGKRRLSLTPAQPHSGSAGGGGVTGVTPPRAALGGWTSAAPAPVVCWRWVAEELGDEPPPRERQGLGGRGPARYSPTTTTTPATPATAAATTTSGATATATTTSGATATSAACAGWPA
jgi:hypothetical protein